MTLKTDIEKIDALIRVLRGKNVMLDSDLAKLYGVETKQLNKAVRRNLKRFPDDFMFQLTPEEVRRSKSQFVTLKNPGRNRLRSQIVILKISTLLRLTET